MTLENRVSVADDEDESQRREMMPISSRISDVCAEKGIVHPVGPEHYAWFTGMDESQFREMMSHITMAHRDLIDRGFSEKGWSNDNYRAHLSCVLQMVAEGNVVFIDDGSLGFAKPDGPRPTADEDARISEKIEAAQPGMDAVLYEMKSVGIT
jgi:hypothetical protein